MAQKPGSFSKNFAWGKGIGLRKLHQAIRKGFGGQHKPVARNTWRQASGIDDDDLSLIPPNFFLHNTIIDGKNYVSVDELVLRALDNDHSPAFDRLALFALHLNRGGARKGSNTGEARPAPWANQFVREHLWKGGSWHRDALDERDLDAFLKDQLDAQEVTRTKVRTNYRRLFELCRYLPASAETIKADPNSWAVSAVYLKWDRLTLDGELNPTADIETLTKQALHGDLHKLLGTTKSKARQIVEVAAPLYIDVGRLDRIAHTPRQLPNITARINAGAAPRYGDAARGLSGKRSSTVSQRLSASLKTCALRTADWGTTTRQKMIRRPRPKRLSRQSRRSLRKSSPTRPLLLRKRRSSVRPANGYGAKLTRRSIASWTGLGKWPPHHLRCGL